MSHIFLRIQTFAVHWGKKHDSMGFFFSIKRFWILKIFVEYKKSLSITASKEEHSFSRLLDFEIQFSKINESEKIKGDINHC